MQWLTAIGVVVGILAGLAGVIWPTVNYFSQRRRKDKPLLVTFRYTTDSQNGTDKIMLVVKAANPGPRPILLEDGGLQFGNRMQWTFRNWETALTLPRRLEETETYVFKVRVKQVGEVLHELGYPPDTEIRAYFYDSLGRFHTSGYAAILTFYHESGLYLVDDRTHDDPST